MYEKTNLSNYAVWLVQELFVLISGAKVSTKVHLRKSVQRICDFNLRTPLSVMPCALTSRASAGFHVRLVFRLCSTLKRLLIHVCGDNGLVA